MQLWGREFFVFECIWHHNCILEWHFLVMYSCYLFYCMSFWRKSKLTLSQIKACYLHVRMKYVISSSSIHSREALQILRMNVTFTSLTDSMWYDQLLESFYLSLQLWKLCWFCFYLFTFFWHVLSKCNFERWLALFTDVTSKKPLLSRLSVIWLYN